MPTISVEQSLLRELVEAKGRKHNIEDLAFRLPLMGTDIDSCDDEKLDIEIKESIEEKFEIEMKELGYL